MPKATKIIRQTEFFHAKPLQVYEALVVARKHAEFTGSRATCDPRVGGKFTAWDGYISGKNLKLNPGKTIVQEWRTTEWPEGYPPSIVKFTFEEAKDGTRLTMVQSKVPPEQVDSYRQGWIDFYWTPLKRYFHQKPH